MFASYERAGAKKAFAVALGTLSCLTVFAGAYFSEAAVRSNSLAVNPGTPVFDSRIQPIAMEALKKGLADYRASAGLAIVADPVRGTIIAAVSVNDGFDSSLKGDWALTTPIEPGSALKPLLLAAAVQHGAVKVDDVFTCGSKYAYGHNIFHDEGTNTYERLTAGDAVVESSNICSIKFSQKLGAARIEAALKDFGIGSGGSAAEYPGARVGYVAPASSMDEEDYVWSNALGATTRSHSQITPLELVSAYSALANGGRLMKAIPADGTQSVDMIRDVVSPEVAGQIREVLRRVVTEGTASGINGGSISIAGKTATAVVNGNRRVTGFVGFTPAEAPKVVVYVAYFDPKGSKRNGSNTAAPVFRDIVEKVVPLAKW